MACAISLSSSGDSTQTSASRPARRSWMPSWSVATPNWRTPREAAARDTSTAP